MAARSQARSWNPDYDYAQRERWICVYPAYLNARKSIAQGRRVPKTIAIDNPTLEEIKLVCLAGGFTCGIEDKVYPREPEVRDMKSRGRMRIQLKKADGTLMNDQFPSRDSVFHFIAEMIPKLKTRAGSAQGATSSGQGATSSNQKQKKSKKR